ncbi:MAG: hypothetical protein R3F49_00880 [Planctomycetota bacterium]
MEGQGTWRQRALNPGYELAQRCARWHAARGAPVAGIVAGIVARIVARIVAHLGAGIEEVLAALWPRGCWLCRAPAATVKGPDACAAHALPGEAQPEPTDPSSAKVAPLMSGLDGARCGICAARLPRGVRAEERCRACRRRPPRFARVVAAGNYRGPLGEWVLAFKHGGREDLAPVLARHLVERVPWLAARALEAPRPELQPVPLHALRHLERGYDQALLLAQALGEELGLPVRARLARTRATTVQGAERGPSRQSNVSGAFSFRPQLRDRWRAARAGWARRAGPHRRRARPLAGREIWLVDDVLTSGATADACARELMRAGARAVTVVVLARASGEEEPEP